METEAELCELVKRRASELEVSARSVGNVELETLAADIRRKASVQLEELATPATPRPEIRLRGRHERMCCRCREFKPTKGGTLTGPRRQFICSECGA